MEPEANKIRIGFESCWFDISGPPIVVTIAAILLLLSIAWVILDAKERDKNPLLAVLFLLLNAWPLSMLWWLWLRPERRKQHNNLE